MSSSKGKKLFKAKKDVKLKPIKLVQSVKKAWVAIGSTPPMSKSAIINGEDGFS